MSELSRKPYLIRAIYEWCADSGTTPYLSVKVDEHVRVPMEYVKNGEIVLSVSQQATRNLTIGNDLIQFSARFNGVSREISIPIYAVQAIFARENGQGMFFELEAVPEGFKDSAAPAAPEHKGPRLAAVDTSSAMAQEDVPLADEGESTATSIDGDPSRPKGPAGPPRGNLRVIK